MKITGLWMFTDCCEIYDSVNWICFKRMLARASKTPKYIYRQEMTTAIKKISVCKSVCVLKFLGDYLLSSLFKFTIKFKLLIDQNYRTNYTTPTPSLRYPAMGEICHPTGVLHIQQETLPLLWPQISPSFPILFSSSFFLPLILFAFEFWFVFDLLLSFFERFFFFDSSFSSHPN